MGRGNEQCKTAEEVTGRFPGLTCSARANVLIGGGGSCCWEAISDGSPVQGKTVAKVTSSPKAHGSGCSTVVERMPCNRDVVGLIPAGCKAFFLFLFYNVS